MHAIGQTLTGHTLIWNPFSIKKTALEAQPFSEAELPQKHFLKMRHMHSFIVSPIERT